MRRLSSAKVQSRLFSAIGISLISAFAAPALLRPSCVYADGAEAVSRSLDQAEVDAGVWIADFTAVPQNLSSDDLRYDMPETQLQSTVMVTPQDTLSNGRVPLGPRQIEQLEIAVTTEMVRVRWHHFIR